MKMNCLVVSFGFNNKFPNFGYELNKLNNYLMTEKPILIIGNKKNLLKERGSFVFVTKNSTKIFERKINFIRKNYKKFLKVGKFNKIKLLKRNNSNEIFKKTVHEKYDNVIFDFAGAKIKKQASQGSEIHGNPPKINTKINTTLFKISSHKFPLALHLGPKVVQPKANLANLGPKLGPNIRPTNSKLAPKRAKMASCWLQDP